MGRRTPISPSGAPRRRHLRLLVVPGLILLTGMGPLPCAEERPLYRGRLLVEVLQSLQERGLRVIYSSAVVDDAMRATVEPAASDPRAILDEILAPLGLRAEDGPGGSVLIVRAGAGAGSVRGRVISSARGTPIAGASVRIPATGASATSGPDGAFLIRDLPPGTHDVHVEAPGYFPRTTGSIVVQPARSRDLIVGLEPHRTYVEEVIVTPGRVALIQQEQPATVALNDEDLILAASFGGDVGRIVESLPGVAAADNSAAFNVRGSLAQDVSFFLDGLELYEPFHLARFQSPFSHLDAGIVDRIDFLGGAFTADHGDRHGGIVRIATRPPDEARRTLVSLGSINSRIAHAARSPGRNASFLASLRGWYPESLRSTIEIGEPGLEPGFGDAYLNAAFTLSPRTVVSAHALLAQERFDFDLTGEEQRLDAAGESVHFWLRGLRSWNDAVSSETVLSAGRIDRSREGVSDPEDEVLLVEDERRTDFLGLRHDTTFRLTEAHMLRTGIDLRRLDADYRYRSGPVEDPASLQTLRSRPSGSSYGFFLADRLAVTSDFAVEAGARWDRQTYTGETQVSPRLNALWRLGERSELRIGLGEYFQSQRIYELRIEDGETEFRPAERSRQAALTFTRRLGEDLRFRLDAYYRTLDRLHPRYENLFTPLELYPETEPDRVLVAPDGARLRGVELLLHAAPGKAFYWRAGYALSSAEDVFSGEGVARSWDQTHAGTFLVGYRIADRWYVSLAGSAHTGWPTTPFRTNLTAVPGGEPEVGEVLGPRNSDRFPAYLRFDLKASRTFTVGSGRLGLEAEVINLTDRRNACCVDDVEVGVRPDGSVRVDSELGYWLGLTPTFRLTWEF